MRIEKLAGETVVINKKEIEDYITNCYGFSSVMGKPEILLNEKKGLIFRLQCNGVDQIFFTGEKRRILEKLEEIQTPHVVEVVSRAEDEVNWLENAGYDRFLTLQRTNKSKLSKSGEIWEKAEVSIAEIRHSQPIMQLIGEKFDYINAHYMSVQQLQDKIEKKTVWIVEKGKREVQAFLVGTHYKSTLCVEFVYNGCPEFKAGDLLKTAENYARENYLKLVYAWADVMDQRARTMYEHNGYHWEERYKYFFTKGMEC